MKVSVAEELKGQFRVGLIQARGLQLVDREEALARELEGLCQRLRQFHTGPQAKEYSAQQALAEAHTRVGVDVTGQIPPLLQTIEAALANRPFLVAHSGEAFILLCAFELFLPIALYDLSSLQGDLEVRRGAPGEHYETASGGLVQAEGQVILADAAGPAGRPGEAAAHVSPTTATTRGLLLLFAPGGHPEGRVAGYLDLIGRRLRDFCHGELLGKAVLG
ncbi:MAG: hypothetical protein HYY85_22550 [Deltaproteobacteria bacterium]|nr:hypothetical protein [Deltaproteobacteria bacterium]